MSDLILGFLSKTLNMDADSLRPTLYKTGDEHSEEKPVYTDEYREDALQQLLELDSKRVESLKGKSGELFNNGYKKAEKEISTKWESQLRQTFGVEDDLTGDDLIKAAKAAAANVKMPEEKVKSHPSFLELEKKVQNFEQEKQQAIEQAIGKVKGEYRTKEIRGKAISKADAVLDQWNPVLPENKEVARNQKQMFFDYLTRNYNFQENDGSLLPMKGETRVENEQGYPLSYEQLVQLEASKFFTQAKQTPKGNAGNGSPGATPPSGAGAAKVAIKTQNDYLKALANAKSSEEIKAINAAAKTAGLTN